MIRTILNNEFNKITNQELSDYEYQVLLDYVDHRGDLDWDTNDLRNAVQGFVEECYETDEDTFPRNFEIKEINHFPMAKATIEGRWKTYSYRGSTYIQMIKD